MSFLENHLSFFGTYYVEKLFSVAVGHLLAVHRRIEVKRQQPLYLPLIHAPHIDPLLGNCLLDLVGPCEYLLRLHIPAPSQKQKLPRRCHLCLYLIQKRDISSDKQTHFFVFLFLCSHCRDAMLLYIIYISLFI